MPLLLLFLILVVNFTLDATLCLGAGRGEASIKYVKVLSERCSGSHYTEALLVTNVEEVQGLHNEKFGIKHFYPWFGYESSYHGPAEDYTFEGSENVLFIILFRDVYDWLRSFNRTTFQGPQEVQGCSFSKFIRTQWGINSIYTSVQRWQTYHPLIDLNPINGQPFENVIKLRAAKIRNMLLVPERVQNYYILNYEQARDFPEEVVREIAKIFELKMKPEFSIIKKVRGSAAEDYVRREYPLISQEDLLYINEELDEELENSIGYKLIHEMN